jgi:hypothetical protein
MGMTRHYHGRCVLLIDHKKHCCQSLAVKMAAVSALRPAFGTKSDTIIFPLNLYQEINNSRSASKWLDCPHSAAIWYHSNKPNPNLPI